VYEFNKQIIASLGEGLAVHDTDLRYVIWNPFMEKMSGRQAAEVIGEHPLELFPFLKDGASMPCSSGRLRVETAISEDKLTPLPTHSTPRWTMTRAEGLIATRAVGSPA
jgi:PAS domain S-box-containing protein